MDNTVINFSVYEDSTEFLGIASVTLPDVTQKTTTVNGAGIAGDLEVPVLGHIDAMSVTINFRTNTEASMKLSEPRAHQITLMAGVQGEDPVTKAITVTQEKHTMVVYPKSSKGGSIAPSSQTNGSGEYAVHYYASYLGGKKVREIDPANMIYEVNGVDYMAAVRKAIGK